jgi:hypothetical protein
MGKQEIGVEITGLQKSFNLSLIKGEQCKKGLKDREGRYIVGEVYL